MRKKKTPTTNLNIRLPVEEKRAFKRAAEATKFDLTTWVRLGLRKLAGMDK